MKYRIIDTEHNLDMSGFHVGQDGVIYQSHTRNPINKYSVEDQKRYIVEICTDFKNIDGRYLYEGDLVWFDVFRSATFKVVNLKGVWVFKTKGRKKLPLSEYADLARFVNKINTRSEQPLPKESEYEF